MFSELNAGFPDQFADLAAEVLLPRLDKGFGGIRVACCLSKVADSMSRKCFRTHDHTERFKVSNSLGTRTLRTFLLMATSHVFTLSFKTMTERGLMVKGVIDEKLRY